MKQYKVSEYVYQVDAEHPTYPTIAAILSNDVNDMIGVVFDYFMAQGLHIIGKWDNQSTIAFAEMNPFIQSRVAEKIFSNKNIIDNYILNNSGVMDGFHLGVKESSEKSVSSSNSVGVSGTNNVTTNKTDSVAVTDNTSKNVSASATSNSNSMSEDSPINATLGDIVTPNSKVVNETSGSSTSSETDSKTANTNGQSQITENGTSSNTTSGQSLMNETSESIDENIAKIKLSLKYPELFGLIRNCCKCVIEEYNRAY